MFFLLTTINVDAKEKILYIPLDSRPVCLSYVVETLAAADYEVITPPLELLANNITPGNPDALWQWLEKTAPKVKSAVISTDSLIYGGLVASRTHHDAENLLLKRAARLKTLKDEHPRLHLYAFSTLMRTPRQSFGNVEPDYYSIYGPNIFALSQLYDKEDMTGHLSPSEIKQKKLLQSQVPSVCIGDWYQRRQKNYKVNELLTTYARQNIFDYLAIGKDDDAPLSQTHLESRHLAKKALDLQSNKFQILPGVDQLGLLLLTKTINILEKNNPKVYLTYAPGKGSSTLPLYSDQAFETSIAAQITALGGTETQLPAKAELILAVNTPFNGHTQDSTANDNQDYSSIHNIAFVKTIGKFIKTGNNVALADVSYANGADNGFMKELAAKNLLDDLVAYSGWNTADNTVGYALCQGLLADKMKLREKDNLLKVRYLDDWFYQSNIRPQLSSVIDRYDLNLKFDLGNYRNDILKVTNKLFQKHLKTNQFFYDTTLTIDFPWNRLFEIDVQLTEKH